MLTMKSGRSRSHTRAVFSGTMLVLGVSACAGRAEDPERRQDSAGSVAAAADSEAASVGQANPGVWVNLLDGNSIAAWRGYKRDDVPASWRVDDSTLAFVPAAEQRDRGDIVTRDQFGDFELEYEWRISEGGNSGVMWRVSEELDYPWQTGPEQQVLDDDRHSDGQIATHRAGGLFDLVAPPSGITKPVGEFNQARIVARGTRVQLYLNGRQTADVDFASEEGKRLLANSKFKSMPRFAQNARGHIVLQDHGDRVWYREIRVREIRGP